MNFQTAIAPGPGRVVIVEDELLVALDLEDILRDNGLDVVGIVAERAGLSDLSGAPEVALVDINLKDGPTGNAIAADLAEQFGTRIIFVTANPDQIAHPPITTVGFVPKPFRSDTIMVAVQQALGRSPHI